MTSSRSGPPPEAATGPSAHTDGYVRAPGMPPLPLAATAIPGYEILDELGRGGMGVVYKARQTGLDRVVALKMIVAGGHSGSEERIRFQIEAEAVALLRHPNIVQVHEVGEHEGQPFLTLEFMPGGSLSRRLDGQPLADVDAARLAELLARALHHAHQCGIIHRDLKPANILLEEAVDTQPGFWTPKVADFGLAKRLDDPSQTASGAILGTPAYMAPEQARAEKGLSTAADIYGLGAILYELLTSRPPFTGPTQLDIMLMVLERDPISPRSINPRLDRDLETICLKCLHKQPAGRYATAEALADDLARFRRGEPIEARPVGSLERGWKWVRRHPAGTGLGVASLVAALALVAFFVGQSYQGRLADANMRLEAALDAAERARRNEERQKEATEEALQRVERFRYFNLISLAGRELTAGDNGRADALLGQCPQPLRGWEWLYLHKRAHVPCTTIRQHADQVLCVAYSSDGERLAMGSRDGGLRIRDENPFSDKVVVIARHTGAVRAVALSPDGLHLASAEDDRLRLFELTNRQAFRHEQAGKPYRERFRLSHHTRPVRPLAYSPDGRLLASADEGGSLWLTETEGRPASRRLGEHRGTVSSLAFSQDGMRLASAGEDRLVKVWERMTGKLLFQLGPLAGPISSVVWGKDGRQLAAAIAAGQAGAVLVWDDPGSGLPPRVLLSHAGGVRCLAANPASGSLAWAGSDGIVRLSDVETGSVTRVLRGYDGTVTSLAFRPDGKFLASGGGRPGQRGEVSIWNLAPAPQPRDLRGHVGAATAIAFNPDGGRLASGGEDGLIRVWDLASNRALLTLKGHQGTVTGVAFSPDLPVLASSGQDGTVRLWSAATAKLLHTFAGHSGPATALAISADGRFLASGGVAKGKGVVTIQDITSRREYQRLAAHAGAVFGVAFSPDGRRLASCGADQTVRVHEVKDGKESLVLQGLAPGGAAVAFSPDGKQFGAPGLDRTVWLWDAVTGKRLHVLAGHSAEVLGMAFSKDGKRLGTAGGDGLVKLWDPETGLEAFSLPASPPHGAAGVAFSRDRRIASANADGSVTVWEITAEEVDHDEWGDL